MADVYLGHAATADKLADLIAAGEYAGRVLHHSYVL